MGNKSHQRVHKYGSNVSRFLFYIITMAAMWRMNSREKKLETINPIEDLIRISRNDYKTVVGEMKKKGIDLESFIYSINICWTILYMLAVSSVLGW